MTPSQVRFTIVRRLQLINRKLAMFCEKFPFALCVSHLFDGIVSMITGNFKTAMRLWLKALDLCQAQGMQYYKARCHYLLGLYSLVTVSERRAHLLEARTLFAKQNAAYDLRLTSLALNHFSYFDLSKTLRQQMGPFTAQSDFMYRSLALMRSLVSLPTSHEAAHNRAIKPPNTDARYFVGDFNDVLWELQQPLSPWRVLTAGSSKEGDDKSEPDRQQESAVTLLSNPSANALGRKGRNNSQGPRGGSVFATSLYPDRPASNAKVAWLVG